MVDTPDNPPSNAPPAPPDFPEKQVGDATVVAPISKDVLRKRNAEQQAYIERVNEQLAVLTRIATLAVARLGGAMRITDEEWASAEGSDFQWRTVRHHGLQPEIHVACTLQGETVVTGTGPLGEPRKTN